MPAQPFTLSWANSRYAANETGLSRQYGESISSTATRTPRAAGSSVGKNAWAKAMTFLNGTAVPIPTTTSTHHDRRAHHH